MQFASTFNVGLFWLRRRHFDERVINCSVELYFFNASKLQTGACSTPFITGEARQFKIQLIENVFSSLILKKRNFVDDDWFWRLDSAKRTADVKSDSCKKWVYVFMLWFQNYQKCLLWIIENLIFTNLTNQNAH